MTETKHLTRESLSFEDFMSSIDKLVLANLGVSIYDLPDACYRDMYDNGYTVEESAKEGLESDDMFLFFFDSADEVL